MRSKDTVLFKQKLLLYYNKKCKPEYLKLGYKKCVKFFYCLVIINDDDFLLSPMVCLDKRLFLIVSASRYTHIRILRFDEKNEERINNKIFLVVAIIGCHKIYSKKFYGLFFKFCCYFCLNILLIQNSIINKN